MIIIILSLALCQQPSAIPPHIAKKIGIYLDETCCCWPLRIARYVRKIVKGHARSRWSFYDMMKCTSDKRQMLVPTYSNKLPRLRFLSLLRFLGCTSPDMLAGPFTVREVIANVILFHFVIQRMHQWGKVG